MQFVIPDVPAEVKTQMQREQLLAKEAKYQHGVKQSDQDQDLMTLLKNQESEDHGSDGVVPTVSSSIPFQGSWARRFSRLQDSLEAHVNVSTRKRKSNESNAWDVS